MLIHIDVPQLIAQHCSTSEYHTTTNISMYMAVNPIINI